jgi:hypothetical protein
MIQGRGSTYVVQDGNKWQGIAEDSNETSVCYNAEFPEYPK